MNCNFPKMLKLMGTFGFLSMALINAAVAQDAAVKPFATVMSDIGFSVSAMIISDPNWLEKWNTPVANSPKLTVAEKLSPGDTATLVTFFSGAQAVDGKITLHCDVKIWNAGDIVQEAPAQLCREFVLASNAPNIYRAGLEIGLEVDDDTFGFVKFDIGVKDMVSGIRLVVSVGYEIETPEILD